MEIEAGKSRMKKRFLAAASALLILPVFQLQAFQAQGTGAANPPQTGEPKQSSTPTPTPTPVKPVITDVVPAAPTISCNGQRLTLSGTGFQKDSTVTLTGPDGRKTTLPAADVTLVSDKELQINSTLSATGRWKLNLANPDKTSSDEVGFNVIDSTSPSVQAYNEAFWVITIALLVIGGAILLGLIVAWANGSWSLGTALSEEAAVQPKEVSSLADVIMVGSTSRLIALVGLLGILTIVLGVGYSVVWNLFVAGKSPDLAYVKSFLFGAASLFAPYLANQVRAAFDQSPAPTPAPQDASELSITGVIPGSPQSDSGTQQLTLTGRGFATGLTAMLADPEGTQTAVTIAPNQINPTQLILNNVTLDVPGNWSVKIAGSGGSQSTSADFLVYGAPRIDGPPTINPTGAANAASVEREITLTGRGFLKGLTASVVPTAGAAPIPAKVKTTEYKKLVITATLAQGNNAQVTVTNPGGFASVPQQFNV